MALTGKKRSPNKIVGKSVPFTSSIMPKFIVIETDVICDNVYVSLSSVHSHFVVSSICLGTDRIHAETSDCSIVPTYLSIQDLESKLRHEVRHTCRAFKSHSASSAHCSGTQSRTCTASKVFALQLYVGSGLNPISNMNFDISTVRKVGTDPEARHSITVCQCIHFPHARTIPRFPVLPNNAIK